MLALLQLLCLLPFLKQYALSQCLQYRCAGSMAETPDQHEGPVCRLLSQRCAAEALLALAWCQELAVQVSMPLCSAAASTAKTDKPSSVHCCCCQMQYMRPEIALNTFSSAYDSHSAWQLRSTEGKVLHVSSFLFEQLQPLCVDTARLACSADWLGSMPLPTPV